jgi:hypothetical protein
MGEVLFCASILPDNYGFWGDREAMRPLSLAPFSDALLLLLLELPK